MNDSLECSRGRMNTSRDVFMNRSLGLFIPCRHDGTPGRAAGGAAWAALGTLYPAGSFPGASEGGTAERHE